MKCKHVLITLILLFAFFYAKRGDAFVIDFEGLADSTPLTNQYIGLDVEFSGATIYTAGVSLNEFEFPPYSGSNVAVDESGPITINFSTPVVSVGGYFTYLSPVTITAYDASNTVVGTATSAFSSNLALSGDPGSSPNEFLQVSFTGGISKITIAGDPAGSSFALDDLTVAPNIIYVKTDHQCANKTPCFATIQTGIDSAQTLTIINITQETYHENVVLNSPKELTLQGGWDATFTTNQSYTIIDGSLTISNGKVIVENIILE
jgi:hypothetical protein